MFLVLVSLFLFLSYTALISFYKYWWEKQGEYEPGLLHGEPPKISVIIAARNEADNIATLLNGLANQSYPKALFEVIVVDDHSTDNTAEIVRAASLQNLQLINLAGDARSSSKKKAIAAGIDKSRGELLVTTDADCLVPVNWLTTIANLYQEKRPAFIAAPVAYQYNNTLVEIFQTIDFLTLQGITAASVEASFHSMCNGANLAYTPTAYDDVNGFAGVDHIASGDDMLLMYKIWKQNPKRVSYLKSKEAIVSTRPMSTWKDFFWQRIRWASKTVHYDDKRVFWSLLLVYLFNVFFLVLFIGGFWNSLYWSVALLLWIGKTTVEFPFVYAVAKFYQQQKILSWFFFLQPLHILYTISIGLLSQWRSYEWKGRKVH